MRLLAVDPGINHCGVAVVEGSGASNDPGVLVWAALVKNLKGPSEAPAARAASMAQLVWQDVDVMFNPRDMDRQIHQLLVEWPKVRAAGKGRGDPSDLLLLSAVAGALAAHCPFLTVVRTVVPEDWKGQVDPDAMTARIISKLTEEEKAKIRPCAPSIYHNVIDAVGIGKWGIARR